ncbi:MAG: hemolysin III family protein [Isosphaeraceae bacterium]|nr:hemolysin III family protein [Isosphaeraceae bacterium]
MSLFELREPVSAGSHGAWALLAVPGTLLLWRRGVGDRGRQLSLLVFGVSLVLCYSFSTLYHGACLSRDWIARFDRLDHVGIFLLIAGSYTPLAWNLLRGLWRLVILTAAWLMAAAGSAINLAVGVLPVPVATALYLAMGWGAIICYLEIARERSHRTLRPLLIGGALYSIGALLNVLRWPIVWPGVVEAHEVFHLFVMAGSLAHYGFMLSVVTPQPGRVEPARLGRRLWPAFDPILARIAAGGGSRWAAIWGLLPLNELGQGLGVRPGMSRLVPAPARDSAPTHREYL